MIPVRFVIMKKIIMKKIIVQKRKAVRVLSMIIGKKIRSPESIPFRIANQRMF